MTANSACMASMVSLDANFGGKRLVHCQHGVFLLNGLSKISQSMNERTNIDRVVDRACDYRLVERDRRTADRTLRCASRIHRRLPDDLGRDHRGVKSCIASRLHHRSCPVPPIPANGELNSEFAAGELCAVSDCCVIASCASLRFRSSGLSVASPKPATPVIPGMRPNRAPDRPAKMAFAYRSPIAHSRRDFALRKPRISGRSRNCLIASRTRSALASPVSCASAFNSCRRVGESRISNRVLVLIRTAYGSQPALQRTHPRTIAAQRFG